MVSRFCGGTLAGIAALALLATRPATAGPPEAPWSPQDVGNPAAAGSADVDNGVWTVKGSGDDVFNYTDSFQFVSQKVKGDGAITARFLSRSGGNSEWAKAGLMVRDDASDTAANLNFIMTPGHGLHATAR